MAFKYLDWHSVYSEDLCLTHFEDILAKPIERTSSEFHFPRIKCMLSKLTIICFWEETSYWAVRIVDAVFLGWFTPRPSYNHPGVTETVAFSRNIFPFSNLVWWHWKSTGDLRLFQLDFYSFLTNVQCKWKKEWQVLTIKFQTICGAPFVVLAGALVKVHRKCLIVSGLQGKIYHQNVIQKRDRNASAPAESKTLNTDEQEWHQDMC